MFDFTGFDPNDPRKAFLLAMGAQIMGARGPLGNAVGQGLLSGMQAHQNAGLLSDQRKRETKRDEMYDMQLAQMREQQAQRQQMQGLARSAFGPNPNLVANDDMGNPMPQAPGGGGMPEFAKGLMGIDPVKGYQLQQQLAQANRPEYMSVAPGATVFDKNAGKAAFTAPDRAPDWLDPRYIQAQSQIRAAGKPQISVNTNMPPLEKKEQQDKGALNVKNFGDLQGAAAAARRENALLSGIEKIPLETGALTPANATVSAWIAALGGGEKFKDTASQAQGFTAFAKDLVLQRQLAQKGPQTESDARRLEQTVANLGNTKEANGLITSFSKAVNNRTIAQEKFYRDWWSKKKTYEGADEAWFSGEGGKSLWDDEKLKKYQNQSGGVTLRFDSQGNPR